MEIYLIRHTTPAVAKGVCYGQTDLDITDTMLAEAAIIRRHLPPEIGRVHSSPLQRCTKLAAHLFPGHSIALHPELMEIHCGQWEMRNWDDLPREEIDPWMQDFVKVRIPGGESYVDLHERVSGCFERIRAGETMEAVTPGGQAPVFKEPSQAIIAHGGVIRSILSHITGTPLAESFQAFSLHYGCVVRVFEGEEGKGPLQYETLSNVPTEKERHKPSRY